MEFTTANELVPPGARYMLYPAIGTLDPLGASQLRSTWCVAPVPLIFIATAGALLMIVTVPV
jgi:hypothetical protein